MPIEDDVRAKLKASNRTPADIAGAVGIAKVTLSLFKGGNRPLSLGKLESLADTLGFQVVLKPKPRK